MRNGGKMNKTTQQQHTHTHTRTYSKQTWKIRETPGFTAGVGKWITEIAPGTQKRTT